MALARITSTVNKAKAAEEGECNDCSLSANVLSPPRHIWLLPSCRLIDSDTSSATRDREVSTFGSSGLAMARAPKDI